MSVGDVRAAGQRERAIEFVGEDGERVRDARAAAGGEAVHGRAAEQHALGAERDGLGDVAAAAHAAVHEDRRRGRRPRARPRAGPSRPLIAPSSWRPPWFDSTTPSHARRDRALGVVGAQHALQQQLPRPEVAETLDVVPAERGIEHAVPDEGIDVLPGAEFALDVDEARPTASRRSRASAGASACRAWCASVNSCRGRSPVRRSRSRLPATGKSLVSTTHSKSAASARRMIASVIAPFARIRRPAATAGPAPRARCPRPGSSRPSTSRTARRRRPPRARARGRRRARKGR